MTLPAGRFGGAILTALLVAACDALGPPSISPRATDEQVVVPPPPGAAQVVACLSISSAECDLVARAVLAVLPAERGSPFSMRVRLHPCPDEASSCPESLSGRDGTVLVEYGDENPPIEYELLGVPTQPRFVIIEQGSGIWTDPIQPGSPRADGEGPFLFEVGHCGLLHVVDFDGSFWVLQGQVEGEHQALDGAESGTIELLDAAHARYVGTGNVAFELARFPGAKRFKLCS